MSAYNKSILSLSTKVSRQLSSTTNSLPSQARVVIAGAGVVANSVAYHFTTNGWNDVVVLEQNTIGSGTSHFGSGTLGMFKPIWHRNLIWYSIKLYKQLQEMGHEIGLIQCGSINLAQTRDRVIALKRRMAYNTPTGLQCEMITPKQVQELHPYLHTEDLEAAVWVPGDAVANPKAICRVLAALARKSGAQYFEHCTVYEVQTANEKVHAIKTNLGTIKCEYFINCAGMWARELGLKCNPQVRIPAYPAEHFYATTGSLGTGNFLLNEVCM